MKNTLLILATVIAITIVVAAQESKPTPEPHWQLHGFIEEQYRPTQDFSATSVWLTAKKESGSTGLFNFSQFSSPTAPTHINWWQSYAGPYGGKTSKIGYIEGGVAAGVEKGGHARFTAYGVYAPKRGGISLFAIHEQGLYKGSGWTRLHLQKQVLPGLKVGYHHQTFLGNGINADWKVGKTPLSFFGAVTRDHGKTKSMVGVRYNF